MQFPLRSILLVAAPLSLLAVVGAAGESNPVEEPEAVVSTAVALVETPRARSPLMTEIHAAFEAAKADLERLETLADQAPDEMEFLRIQRQIDQIHTNTELRILQVQADHHRQAGNLEAAQRIESSIEKMISRRVFERPEPRPALSEPHSR